MVEKLGPDARKFVCSALDIAVVWAELFPKQEVIEVLEMVHEIVCSMGEEGACKIIGIVITIVKLFPLEQVVSLLKAIKGLVCREA